MLNILSSASIYLIALSLSLKCYGIPLVNFGFLTDSGHLRKPGKTIDQDFSFSGFFDFDIDSYFPGTTYEEQNSEPPFQSPIYNSKLESTAKISISHDGTEPDNYSKDTKELTVISTVEPKKPSKLSSASTNLKEERFLTKEVNRAGKIIEKYGDNLGNYLFTLLEKSPKGFSPSLPTGYSQSKYRQASFKILKYFVKLIHWGKSQRNDDRIEIKTFKPIINRKLTFKEKSKAKM